MSRSKRALVGCIIGVFNLFHVGHVRLLGSTKGLCSRLVVGVSTDKLAQQKSRPPIVSFEDRLEVVRPCRFVDATIPQESFNKVASWRQIKYDVLLVGNDWFQTPSWESYEEELKELGATVTYSPYTQYRSSTLINRLINQERGRTSPTLERSGVLDGSAERE